jgi:hypothetical protein
MGPANRDPEQPGDVAQRPIAGGIELGRLPVAGLGDGGGQVL